LSKKYVFQLNLHFLPENFLTCLLDFRKADSKSPVSEEWSLLGVDIDAWSNDDNILFFLAASKSSVNR